MSTGKIFISHSSKDEIVCRGLTELMLKCGVPAENIVATSYADTSLVAGQPLYGQIKHVIQNECVLSIFLLSRNYYASPICLNEMGAIWLKGIEKTFYFVLPGFSFKNVEGVITEASPIGISLSKVDDLTKSGLDNLKICIEEQIDMTIDSRIWSLAVKDFLQSVEQYRMNEFKSKNFSLYNAEGFCINDTDHDGCVVIKTKSSSTKAVVEVDFSKTSSSLCSVVNYIIQRDWLAFFREGKHLCFDICTDGKFLGADVEIQFEGYPSVRKKIYVDGDIKSHKISLDQFTPYIEPWEKVKEVNFLFRKKDKVERFSIIIENLRLE